MARLSSIEQIVHLYATQGALAYGEGVTQLEHAVQCAQLARQSGGSPSLVVAALLHDVGHLFEDESAVASFSSDDHHEITGADALSDLFAEAVTGPIALHVAAKRYLCWKEPQYYEGLSAASKATLALQGGPFETGQALAFERLNHFHDALALRRFDDTGKRLYSANIPFSDFIPLMNGLLNHL